VLTLLLKPLIFPAVVAGGAALAARGRFSLRLLFDTSIALAALPVIQVLAFAIVYWTGRRPVGFASALDAYFDGLWPWFFALAVIGLFGATTSPIVAARWFGRVGASCGVLALLVSARFDWRYFTDVLGRGPRRAAADVAVQRAIGWSATLLYFLVTAVPKVASFIPDVAANLFGARP
jgi:hypothetical protein